MTYIDVGQGFLTDDVTVAFMHFTMMISVRKHYNVAIYCITFMIQTQNTSTC